MNPLNLHYHRQFLEYVLQVLIFLLNLFLLRLLRLRYPIKP
ncbi:MAG TPA: hypothetical protein [Caudoviricetes sp.]|nr:MAG TPA: hypothetical protein [Caudoviricetes sp.]